MGNSVKKKSHFSWFPLFLHQRMYFFLVCRILKDLAQKNCHIWWQKRIRFNICKVYGERLIFWIILVYKSLGLKTKNPFVRFFPLCMVYSSEGDICCLNISFLKHEGFHAFFIFHNVPLSPSSSNKYQKELDLVKMVERKGGTAIQICLPIANKNVHRYTI